MNETDNLQRFLFEDAPVRGEFVHLQESIQTILNQHTYPPLIRQLLGEALVAASLLSSVIKFQGRLTLQFQGKGNLKLFIAQCNHEYHLRGLAQWQGEFDEESLLEDLQKGTIAILIDSDMPGGKRYQGIVEWQGRTLAESIEGYFKQSEQLPTKIWLAINENKGAGLMLQVMPKDRPELYTNDWEHLVLLTNTITPNELLTLDNQTLLHRLYSEEDVRLFPPTDVKFQCNCSEQRSENAILILGKAEAEQELTTKKEIIVTCDFCQRSFVFDQVDVARIFNKNDKPFDVH